MRTGSLSALACAFAITIGCGSAQRPSQSVEARQAPPARQHQPGGGMCPMMQTAGTQVASSDTSDGAAIAFTTSGDPAELRAHVHRMAEMHNKMQQDGMGKGPKAWACAGAERVAGGWATE